MPETISEVELLHFHLASERISRAEVQLELVRAQWEVLRLQAVVNHHLGPQDLVSTETGLITRATEAKPR